jgi:hypothetical protein
VRPSKIAKLLPLIQFLVQVHIVFVNQQLIELLLVGAVGPLYLAVELRRSRFDIRMSDTQVFNMTAELRLELMTTIGPDLLDTKRQLGNDVVNKGNRVLLRMAIVDLERSQPCVLKLVACAVFLFLPLSWLIPPRESK